MPRIGKRKQQHKTLGIAAGLVAYKGAMISKQLIDHKIMNKIAGINKSLTADEFKSVENAFNQILETSGLSKKGVEVINVTKDSPDLINPILLKELDNHPIYKFMPKKVKNFFVSMKEAKIKISKQAFYAPSSKAIVTMEKGLDLSAFHESMHAFNDNISKIGKFLYKSRNISLLAIPIGLIAFLKTDKSKKSEQKESPASFIKNNAGKLVFAVSIPKVLEEALASIRANKQADKLLSKNIANKMKKSNLLAFGTYVGTVLFSSLAICVGLKIKDKMEKTK